MQTKDFIGLVISILLFIWIVYSLIYWTNLAWRYPKKLEEFSINAAKSHPKWSPFRSYILKNAKKRSPWPARLRMMFIDIAFASVLLMIIFAIIN